MGRLLFCLALNLGVGFYLHLVQPITTFYKAFQMKRSLNRARVAGL